MFSMEKNIAALPVTNKLAGDGFGAETGAVPFVGEGQTWRMSC